MAVVLEWLTRLQTKSVFCYCIFRHTRHTTGDWSSKFGGTEHVPPVGCFSRRRTRGAECYQWQWQWTMRDSLLPIMIMISCRALQVAPCLLHPRVGGWMKSYFMSSFAKYPTHKACPTAVQWPCLTYVNQNARKGSREVENEVHILCLPVHAHIFYSSLMSWKHIFRRLALKYGS